MQGIELQAQPVDWLHTQHRLLATVLAACSLLATVAYLLFLQCSDSFRDSVRPIALIMQTSLSSTALSTLLRTVAFIVEMILWYSCTFMFEFLCTQKQICCLLQLPGSHLG